MKFEAEVRWGHRTNPGFDLFEHVLLMVDVPNLWAAKLEAMRLAKYVFVRGAGWVERIMIWTSEDPPKLISLTKHRDNRALFHR